MRAVSFFLVGATLSVRRSGIGGQNERPCGWRRKATMFRRKTVLAQGLCEEKSVYDCLNKLMVAQTRGALRYFAKSLVYIKPRV